MNNQYPRRQPNENYYNPQPAATQLPPLSFDPNSGFSGGYAAPSGFGPSSVGGYMNGGAYQPNAMQQQQNTVGQIASTNNFDPNPIKTFGLDGGSFEYGNQVNGLSGNSDAFDTAWGKTEGISDNYKGESSLGSAWDKMGFGEKGAAVLGGVSSVYGMYNAHKAGKLAKDQFSFQKKAFNKNFDAQAKMTNSGLADRQAARYARNPDQHKSVKDYMTKYGV